MKQKEYQTEYWKEGGMYRENRRNPENKIIKHVYQPKVKCILDTFDKQITSVLDVGCGNGFLQYWLEKEIPFVTGLDLSLNMLRKNPNKIRICGNAFKLPFRDDSFDLVIDSYMLHHVVESERQVILNEMARVAKKGVILLEPNRKNPFMFLFGSLVKAERMSLKFNKKYIEELLVSIDTSSPYSFKIFTLGIIPPNATPLWMVKLLKPLEKIIGRSGFGINLMAILKLG